MNLNPFLIDEDELFRINDRDDLKDLYDDESFVYEESQSSVEISECSSH